MQRLAVYVNMGLIARNPKGLYNYSHRSRPHSLPESAKPMKKLILFLLTFVALILGGALLYAGLSPDHAATRSTLRDASPAVREAGVRQALAFEQQHLRALLLHDNQAQYAMGLHYQKKAEAENDSPALRAKAVTWMQRAALNNHAGACMMLARYALLGYGMPQSEKEAAQWVERAAELGDAKAAGLMGILYMSGAGVEQDFSKAKFWLSKSDDAKAVDLAFKLDAMEQAMKTLPESERAKIGAAQMVAAAGQLKAAVLAMTRQLGQTLVAPQAPPVAPETPAPAQP